jgi:hypothetical protein
MTLFPVPPGDDRELFEGDLEPDPVSESQARASRDGREFDIEALQYLVSAGATVVQRHVRVEGYRLDALVEGTNGARYYVDAHGSPDRTPRPQAGMRRQDTALKFGYKALYLARQNVAHPLLLVTSHMPSSSQSAARILQDLANTDALWDAVAVGGDFAGFRRLQHYFTSVPPPDRPLSAPWRETTTQLSLEDADLIDDAAEF